ncbi:MAG: HEAT repeat domain-containing protein [Planctomycetes bacterium]|nr:HEAT repeat domain-containing protein [Planctomycetota bacterium]
MKSLVALLGLLASPLLSSGDPGGALDVLVDRLGAASPVERRWAELDLVLLCRPATDELRAALRDRAARAQGPAKRCLDRQLAFLDAPAIAGFEDVLLLFDGLGMPPAAGKPFVLVNTGGWMISGSDEDRTLSFHYALGFMVGEDAESVSVLDRSLAVVKCAKHPDPPPDWEHFRKDHPEDLPLPGEKKEIDFAEFCRSFLSGGVRDYFGAFDHLVSGGQEHPVEAALFGCLAFERGDPVTAGALFGLAEDSLDDYREHRGWGYATLADAVRDSLADNVRWRAINAANDGGERKELRAMWETVARTLVPTDTPEAEEMLRLYSLMIEEDAARREPTAEEVAAMPPAQQAEHWIHRLRDLAETQCSQPGSCSVFGPFGMGVDGEGQDSHPAFRLLRLGPDAVPALIEHLDDPRPTRCMGFWRNFAPASYHLLRVGDACAEILSRIAGRSFFVRRSTNSYMQKDGETEAVKKEALEWWKEFREQGEERILAQGVASGGRDAPEQARKLRERYPGSALGPIVAGLRAAADDWIRGALVRELGEIEGEGPLPALREGLLEGPGLAVRLAAAEVLFRRGSPEALPAMIREWTSGSSGGGRDSVGRLVQFLLRSGSVEAVRALADGLGERRPDERFEVVDAVADVLDPPGEVPILSSDVLLSIEDLLVAALTDRLTRSGYFSRYGTNPRTCDAAAVILSGHFGGRYAFDRRVPEEERDARIAGMIEAWREARGIPPPPPAVAPVPTEVVAPLLDRLVGAAGEEERAAAVREIEPLGLGALGAVEGAAAGLPADHPARPALADLALRLALVVREVRAGRRSLPLPADLAVKADALRGRPLAPEAVLDLAAWWLGNAPGPDRSFLFEASRTSAAAGVTVVVSIETADPGEAPEAGRARCEKDLRLGPERVEGAGHTCPLAAKDHLLPEEAVRKVLSGAPEVPFLLRFVLTVHRP